MAFEIKSDSGDYLVRGVVMNQRGSVPGGIMVMVAAHKINRTTNRVDGHPDRNHDFVTDHHISTERRARKIAEQRARTLARSL